MSVFQMGYSRRYDGLIRRKRKQLISGVVVGNGSVEYDVVIRDDDGSFDDFDGDDDDDQPPLGGPLLRIAKIQERFQAPQSNENSLLEPSSYQPEEARGDVKPDQATLDAYAEQFRSANSSTNPTETSTPIQGERMYECKQCDRKFNTKSNLWSHNRLHEGHLPFGCKDCGTTFGRIKSLNLHRQKYHSKDSTEAPPERLKCEYCPRVFPRNLDRVQHMKKGHPTLYYGQNDSTERRPSTAASQSSLDRSTPAKVAEPPKKKQKKEVKPPTPAVSESSQFPCEMCTLATFTTAELLEEHVQSAHPKDSILTCSLCPKTFKSRQTLRMHILNHQGKLPHQCEDCGSRFDRKFYLAKHRERYHKGTDSAAIQCRLKCKFCPRIFIRKMDRKTHTRMVHAKEIRIKREKLDKGYGDVVPPADSKPAPPPLANTSGELSFCCLRCGEQFPSTEMLREHTEDQHSKKPPPKIRDDKSLLLPTIKIKQEPGTTIPSTQTTLLPEPTDDPTRPFKCPYCPKSFSRKHVMKEHTFIHTGTLKHRCEECHVMFNRPAYLEQHIAKYHSATARAGTHPQLKFRAMMCGLCPRRFVRRQDLKKHEGIAHGIVRDGEGNVVVGEVVGPELMNGGGGGVEQEIEQEEEEYDDGDDDEL